MSEYTIRIGGTRDTRHIGIQPPLETEQRHQVFSELGKDIETEAYQRGVPLYRAGEDLESEYSELMLNATWMVEAKLTSNDIAGKIAEVLRSNGDLVEVKPGIISLASVEAVLFRAPVAA